MAKLILLKNDTVLRDISLSKERITIGRRPHNDIVIEDLAISGEHAAIVTVNGDSILEDLNSTNGTQVNGQPVRKHFLQDGDVIEVAQFRMTYFMNDAACAAEIESLQFTARETGKIVRAAIKVLNGPSAGREIELGKALTTIGRPGIQVAVLAHSTNAIFLAPVEGTPPIVNGRQIDQQKHQLADGDVIDLAGTQMQLCFLH